MASMAQQDTNEGAPQQDYLQLGKPIPAQTQEIVISGLRPEDVLEQLYYLLGKWMADVKSMAYSGRIELPQYLIECLQLAQKRGYVRNCSDETALKLLDRGGGPEWLLFFLMKCPHCREDFLRGELPPYPWKTLRPVQVPVENASAKKSAKRRRIIRPPSDDQQKIATFYENTGMTQAEVAKLLTAKYGRPISQGIVSRSITAVNRWRGANPYLQLPQIQTGRRKISTTVSPDVLELGKRTKKDSKQYRQKQGMTD